MIRNILIAAALAVTMLTGVNTVQAKTTDLPGKGVTVRPGRATWNTGFFQEALVRRGLKELGYDVKAPKDLANPIFYKSVTLGDLDYWTNGWFPMHNSQLPKDFNKYAEKIGYVVKAGALQGYLVDKKDAEKYHITSLDDFKRPEVRKAFDTNDDGKADLTACPPGWGCHKVISWHMKVYHLEKYIKPETASYEAGMAATLAAYRTGKPIFFYTWAPNWTIFKLKPGKDVVWINVPKIIPMKSQEAAVSRMTVSGVKGAVTNPIKMGFVTSDIRIVANKKFLEHNPAAKEFFKVFTLPLKDINHQATLMYEGQKSQADIEANVTKWIAENKTKWDGWLKAARDAAK
jgi:glycine betaine/proline transport system substrate-binding protein